MRGDSGGVTVGSLVAALAGQVRDRWAEERRHASWLADLTSRAHEQADDQDWCEQFDDFMESVGLERRTREYELRVSVTATVYLTREASNLTAAIESIDEDDVWSQLDSDDISFEVEEDD